MASLKLFSNKVCPFVQRASIAALEKNVPNLETVHVSLSEMPDWYKALNPRETVPALSVNGKLVFESMFIVQYFDEAFSPTNALYPTDPQIRADMRYFMDEAGNLIGQMYDTLTAKPEELQAQQGYLRERLAVVEALLERQSSGPFFLGNAFSAADIAIVPFLIRFRSTLAAYVDFDLFASAPRLAALFNAAIARPSVSNTTEPAEYYIEEYKGYAKGPRKTAQPKLYYSKKCPFAHRAWIAANVLKANVELVEVSLPTPEWYKAIHPRETVPALATPEGKTVLESMFVVEYLSETHGNAFLPADPLVRADIRFFIDDASGLTGAYYGALYSESFDQEQKDGLLQRAQRLEAQINEKGPFFAGESLSIADVAVLPFLVRIDALLPAVRQFDLLAQAPRLKRLLDAGRALPGVASTLLTKEEYLTQFNESK